MIQNTDVFKNIIKNIASEGYSFGNKLLYDMCNDNDKGQEWSAREILADKIWLIGRSYAASPERRYTSGKSPKVGDGTGNYFKSVAEFILTSTQQEGKLKDILKNNKFRFDFSDNDMDVLFAGIDSVLKFNSIIKKASLNYDEGFIEEDNYKNQISFCSKFLHFHFPDSVFIIDSFSKASAMFLFSDGSRTNAEISWNNESVKVSNNEKPKGAMNLLEYKPFIATGEDFEKNFDERLKKLDLVIRNDEYANHCLRAYKVACLFKMYLGNEQPSSSYPRIVDTLLLSTKPLNQ